MGSERVKLPENEAVFASSVSLRKEWVMDPPPWIVSRIRDKVLVEIYRVKIKHLAAAARIESEMFNDVAKILAKQR